ncbi:pentaheme c-type cytochrome TorC, partial [Escherichia coli]
MRKLWNALRRPSARWSVLALVAIGIVIGIALIVLPHVGIKVTSTTEFCVSCHSMQPVYEEYKQSVHFQNASGVRAECHDCHIPPDIPGMVKRKLEASNDIYQTFIAHSIDTPEKFEAKRAELAEREWARMKENNSATCRSCHNYDAMDHAKQHPEAARQMKVAAKDNQSCIDCHKGIAHQLPDMSSGFRKQFDELRASANDSGDTLYSIDIKPIYAAKGDKEASGSLLPASEVKVLKRDGDWLQIEITGGVRRIHLQIFQQGAFFTFIETGKANHAVERADPTVSVKVGDFRCAVALVTGAVVQRIRISPDRFDIVHHVAFLHPRSGLQLAPLGIGVGNGGFLQRFYLLLHITTNRGNKDAFTWELGEHTLTSGAFRPAGNFNLQPVAVTFKDFHF